LLSEPEGCRFDSLLIPDNEEMNFISNFLSSENSLFPFILLRNGQQIGLFRIPKIAGKDLDLHLLYIEVTSRGGSQQVLLLYLLS
jgi:hypothetical protein